MSSKLSSLLRLWQLRLSKLESLLDIVNSTSLGFSRASCHGQSPAEASIPNAPG